MMNTAALVERRRRLRQASRPTGSALLDWARRTLGEHAASAESLAPRRLGPMTPAEAESLLDRAQTPEQALNLFFDFAKHYFEYAAMFLVHGDLAEGYRAWGPGAS